MEALKAEIRAKAVKPTKKPSGLKPGKKLKKMVGPPLVTPVVVKQETKKS